tara:strand:- start:627 stop:1541 length:915 start_codon:yes stop_codon:yes gene_type:complete
MKTRKNKSKKHVKKTMSRHKKHHHNHDEKFKPQCSPNPNNKQYTCYSDEALAKMKNYWNARHPQDKISSNDTKEIWSFFKKAMSHICHRESCWLRSKFMTGKLNNELLNYTFAPSAPTIWKRNPDEWLSSLDIESVMRQYEKFYKCFEFLGPSPIDYDTHKLYGECVWEELCNFNLSEQIKRHKNKIGIILNTDPHYKEGAHWIAIFINIKNKTIVYFDSNGDEAPKEVNKLVKTIVNQGKQLGIDFQVKENKIEHQRTNTECGMYCLYFIIQMLKDKNLSHFLNNRIDDKEVFKLRNEYFNVD